MFITFYSFFNYIYIFFEDERTALARKIKVNTAVVGTTGTKLPVATPGRPATLMRGTGARKIHQWYNFSLRLMCVRLSRVINFIIFGLEVINSGSNCWMVTQGQTERLGNRNEGPLDLQGRVDLRLQGTLRHTLLHNFKVNIISIYILPFFVIRVYFFLFIWSELGKQSFFIREQWLSGYSIRHPFRNFIRKRRFYDDENFKLRH